MNCAELDVLLCDYIDGTLAASERGLVEAHLASCASCAALAQDMRGAVAFIERAAVVEPPGELLTRILHDIPGRGLGKENSFWSRVSSRVSKSWIGPILQPRYAMGMAMTILSFSMLARFAGISPHQLRPADLDPVRVWNSVEDRAHRTWDRAVKYYDNLRLVIEIQSRVKELTDQEQNAPRPAGKPGNGAASDRRKKS